MTDEPLHWQPGPDHYKNLSLAEETISKLKAEMVRALVRSGRFTAPGVMEHPYISIVWRRAYAFTQEATYERGGRACVDDAIGMLSDSFRADVAKFPAGAAKVGKVTTTIMNDPYTGHDLICVKAAIDYEELK